MKTIQEDCGMCGEEVEKAVMGFVPHAILQEEAHDEHVESSLQELVDNFLWGNAIVCLNCGAPALEPVNQKDMERAAQRYVNILLEYDVMTREEVENIGLGNYVQD